jgi:DNA-binding HxlR family transcriptional regulator
VLSLFSTTLHGLILGALVDGPVRLSDLHARAGEPALKTLRGNIGNLIGIGALEKRKPGGEQDLLDNELTPFGRDLLLVAEVLEDWLTRAPDGPLDLDSEAAKDAIKALLGGWGSKLLRVLAARPSSLDELDELIGSFSRAALERRLAAMRIAGQVTTIPRGASPTYVVSDWLREGAAPLLASMRCERLHPADGTAPLGRTDVETLFLLAVPLLGPLEKQSGTCQIAVDMTDGAADGSPGKSAAGVSVAIEQGRVASCVAKHEPDPGEWVRGPAADWLDAIVEGDPQRLEAGGPDGLPAVLVEGLNERLFTGSPAARGRFARIGVAHGSARP